MLWKKLHSESRTVSIFADNGAPQRNYPSGNFFFGNYSINKKVDCVPNSVCIALFYSVKTGQVLKLLRKWSFQVGMDMVERFGLGISGFFDLV